MSLHCRDEGLMEALVAVEIPVVLLPDKHLRKIFSYMQSAPTLLSPDYVRSFILRKSAAAHKACSGRTKLTAALLGYCLRDVDDAQPDALVSSFPLALS